MLSRKIRPKTALLVVLGAAVLTSVAAGPALGAEDKTGPEGANPITEPVPGDFRSWDELFAMQNRLNAAADRIEGARDTAGGRDDGYVGIMAAPTNRRLQLWWKDPIPPVMLKAIDEARRDVPVVVASGRHSERELLDLTRPFTTERAVTGVGPNLDGSGLTVSVSISEAEARQLPAVRTSPVPVTIEPFDTSEALFDPDDDAPPYWGGARYSTPSGGCSTGFAVRQSGKPRMLTAGHCGNNGQLAHDGGGDFMGSVMNDNPLRDILIIDTLSSGRTYVSGPAPNSSVPVKGAASNFVGNFVCTSGAYTRTHCPLMITALNKLIITSSGSVFFPMVKATHLFGGAAVGHGDSGGPVISWANFLAHQAMARGTISAGSGSVGPCGQSSNCYKTVYYADIKKSMASYTSAGFPTTLITG